MLPHQFLKQARSWLPALATFLIAVAVVTGSVWKLEQFREERERNRVDELAQDHAALMQREIERSLSVSYALAALVQQARGELPDFEATAGEMLRHFPGASALGLAPGGVVSLMVPLAGNEGAIGHDMLAHPAQATESLRARDSGRLTLAGPIQLVQGGQGVVGRLPVFLEGERGEREFWGFVTVMLRLQSVLEAGQLQRLAERGIDYRLVRRHPDSGLEVVIASSTSAALIDPVVHSVILPNGAWSLGLAPAAGWRDTYGFAARIAIGIVIGALLGWLVRLIQKLRSHRGRLEATVTRRTAELQEREADLNRAQALAHIGSWVLQYPEKTLHWSAETYRIMGIAPGTPVNQAAFRECIHPDDRAAVKREWQQALMVGKPYQSEFRVLVNGDVRWVRSEAELALAPDGRALRGVGTLHDITGRKSAEEALQRSEAQFRGLFQQSPIGMAILAKDGRYLDVNEALCRITGYDAARLTGGTFEAITHPDDMDASRELMRRLVAGEADSYDIDKRYVRPDDVVVLVRLRAQVIRDREGNALFLLAVVEDITERMAAEIELRIAAVAFEAQQAMFVTDATGVVQRVNREFTVTTGFSAAEAVGRKRDLLRSSRHDAAFYRSLSKSLAEAGFWRGEIWTRRKSGEIYPAWVTITAVKSADGTITHHICTLNDISLQKAAEEDIRHLAYHDPLTRLPNRRLLRDRILHALATGARNSSEGALLYLDLDRFKSLNDTRGHDTGDQLLGQVAARLQACVRESDTVARIGGDEFVVLLENLGSSPEAARSHARVVAEKLLASLNEPYELTGGAYQSTPSIGITLLGGRGADVDELLKQADHAMYEAKAAGRNTLRFFNPETPLSG